MSANIKSLGTLAAALMISFSVSACSSTLAPEDDSTTEYVFQQSKSGDQVVSKAEEDKGTARDTSDD